jgi:hypothetical protein
LLIIRGDLRSRTGLAYHARAQMQLLAREFDIIGVDVHPDPNDRRGPFLYPIISDDEVSRRIATSQDRPIVLHHTPPDDFRSFPGHGMSDLSPGRQTSCSATALMAGQRQLDGRSQRVAKMAWLTPSDKQRCRRRSIF